MKIVSRMATLRLLATLALALLAAFGIPSIAAAQTGAIEFSARATPASGIDEPVRGFPFYLLSKSYEQINKEATAAYPLPDMNAFVDKLGVSKELKAWMEKNHWVKLSGDDFLKRVKPEDLVTVPEFLDAYASHSDGSTFPDFPRPKYKPGDKTKHPDKYKKLVDEYHQAVERYAAQDPASKDSMDLGLEDIDPSAKWQELVAKRNPAILRRALDLAQSKYLVARTETTLQGQGLFNGVPPGTYWLSTLNLHAEVGDVRPQWDVPVMVQPGQTAQIALSNVNAIQPAD
jgi:hypothetical protein